MLTNETISKLNEMHLGTMAAGFTAQLTDPQFQSLSFEERFSILVDAEWSARKSNRLAKLIKKAGYSAPGASIEDISFLPERKLDQAQILRLASCTYIREAQNVIILGATGTGKTYLACALGMAANRNYYEVKYIRLPDLLVEIAMARATNIYQDLMRRYKKVPKYYSGEREIPKTHHRKNRAGSRTKREDILCSFLPWRSIDRAKNM